MSLANSQPARAVLQLPTGLVLALPAIAFLGAFMLYPVANLAYLSLNDYSPLRSADLTWVGPQNYTEALKEPATLASIWISVIFTAFSVAIEVAVGLLIAVLMARVSNEISGRLGRVLRRVFVSGFILPFAIPSVTAAVVWKLILDPQVGPVDTLLGAPIPWFSQFPLTTVIIVDAWKTMPFVMFLLYAAIMSIDASQFEAARLDGANRWQEFWYLTLPGILPVLAVTAAFRAVDAFTKAFDIILVTTAGGPGQASMVFPLYIWRTAFISLHFGQASALAVIAIVVSAFFGVALLSVNRRPA